MRSLHRVEEKLYARELDVTVQQFKVLLYIRHESIRWDVEMSTMSMGDISKATGIARRHVSTSITHLLKKNLISIQKTMHGRRNTPNKIGLNPDYFGELIEETGRPNFTVIQGGASEKLSTGVPQTGNMVFPNGGTECSLTKEHEQGQEPPPAQQPSDLKNPLKEPYKKLLSKIPESFTLSGKSDREVEEENREKLRLQRVELEARGWK